MFGNSRCLDCKNLEERINRLEKDKTERIVEITKKAIKRDLHEEITKMRDELRKTADFISLILES